MSVFFVAVDGDTRVVAEAADDFVSIDTYEKTSHGGWKSDESVAIPWSMVPKLAAWLQKQIAAKAGGR